MFLSDRQTNQHRMLGIDQERGSSARRWGSMNWYEDGVLVVSGWFAKKDPQQLDTP
jgi:hypothetical protein